MEVSLSRSLVVDACELVFFSHPPRRDLRGSFPQFSLVGARSHRGCSPANLPVPLVVPWGAQIDVCAFCEGRQSSQDAGCRVCRRPREHFTKPGEAWDDIFNSRADELHGSIPASTVSDLVSTAHLHPCPAYPLELGQSGGANAGRPPLLPSFWRDTLRRRRRVAPFATAMAIAAPGPQPGPERVIYRDLSKLNN